MSKFHICATRLKSGLHGYKPSTAIGLTMYFQPCGIPVKTSRGEAFTSKGFGHVFFSTVLADGRCHIAHVPPLSGNRLLKDYL